MPKDIIDDAEAVTAQEEPAVEDDTECANPDACKAPQPEEGESLGGGFPHLAAEGLFGNLANRFTCAGQGEAEHDEPKTVGDTADATVPETDGDGSSFPTTMRVFPVRHTVVFPFMLTPVQASREKSVKVVEQVMESGDLMAIATQRDADMEDPEPNDLFPAATAARIVKTLRLPDGSVNLLVQGLHRVRLLEFVQEEPCMVARVELITEHVERSIELEGLIRNAQGLFQKIVSLTPYLPDELSVAALNIDDPEKLSDFIASSINLSTEEKAGLLATGEVSDRFKAITVFLNREFEIVETGAKIQSQVRNEVDKSQKEFYLRRQMELIQQELGQGDDQSREVADLRSKIAESGMSAEAREEADRELDRLEKMHPSSSEYTVARSYLDWLTNLPWAKCTEDKLRVSEAEEVLNHDHYGLVKAKERILEYLAVRKLKADMKGPILCFVGPPGVGKTSLGQSIARALGRKFVRISLGGIHDEAEIRGHRRTYVGALPGKILQGLRKAGTKNPVFMLDEIDKVGADYRGDPSSALLEVLDPAQNGTFQDHYLGVSFDLSQVLFITTANLLDPIPAALKDRMEVLEIPGYTEDEKLHIAQGFLVPRQLENHGMTTQMLKFSDGALTLLIQEYTREAGVRNLDREVANICRKVARDYAMKLELAEDAAAEAVAEQGTEQVMEPGSEEVDSPAGPTDPTDPSDPVVIRPEDAGRLLGIPRYHHGLAGRADEVGVVTGLSWTPMGGEILFIEVALVEGRGRLTLTGRLGETMQESAKAAMTYARSRAKALGFPAGFHRVLDIHLHVPEGGIPKDGPSAGVTMATALISALTGRPVRKDVAMTGEVTLRGRVLPIGGLKEKVLAAHRAGIKTIVLPKDNAKDVSEIPEHIRESLKLVLVENVDEVLAVAINWDAEPCPPPELTALANGGAPEPHDGDDA